MFKKILISACLFLIGIMIFSSVSIAAEMKIVNIDLREVFYEYGKTKEMEQEINSLTEESGKKHDAMVEEITKMRDEFELLAGDAKAAKQQEIDVKLQALQQYDREARKELLNKRNDIFKEIIDDIQSVVKKLGEKNGYDFVLDSRSIMYSKDTYNISKEVLEKLNAKE